MNRLVFFTLLIIPIFSVASNFNAQVMSQDANSLKIKFVFEKPHIVTIDKEHYAFYDKAALTFDQTGAKIPVINKLISLPGERVQVNILSSKTNTILVENYIQGESGDPVNAIAKADYLGKYRDVSVFSLKIYPIKYDFSGKILQWTEEVVVEVKAADLPVNYSLLNKTSETSNDLEKVLLNGNQALHKENNQQLLKETEKIDFLPAEYDVAFKVTVLNTGLYKITYQDLLDADFPFSSVNPEYLSLFNKGKEVPIYIKGVEDQHFDPQDYIEFWGEKNEKTFLSKYPDLYTDPFSDQNVYWLVQKNKRGLRLVEESGGVVEGNDYIIPFKYKETLHFENDTRREIFGHNPEFLNQPSHQFDHWFWGNVISSVESRSFEFHLPYPDQTGSTVYITAMMRGVSSYVAQTNPLDGHQVSVWLNGQKVGEITPQMLWKGQTMRSVTNNAPLSQSNLKHGTNTLRVDMDQLGVTDVVLFNWFDISYFRKYKADENQIKFKLQEDLFSLGRIIQFQVNGFTTNDIEIYKLGVSKMVNGQIALFNDETNNSLSYRIIIQDRIYDPDIEYVAVTESAKKKPVLIEAYEPWKKNIPGATILDKSNVADLVIISNELFSEQVDRLKTLKEQAGFAVQTVTVEQIYDTFNFGIKSPLAIKDFLKYAYYNWDQSRPLKYVILVGDASYDYKEKTQNKSDFVPTILFTTDTYGAAPADIQYALVSGDDLIPDLVIGRIPATRTDELAGYIDKIEQYQTNPTVGVWRNSALFISGSDAGSADREDYTNKPVFRAQNNRILDLKLPQNVFASKLNTVLNDPYTGSTRELIDYFDDGVTFINFFGHGGGAIWADQVLFDLNDVDNLNNEGKYPFISSMTCFTGAFENANKVGLAEKLLMAKDKGAIAVLSSSSVGWKYNDFAVQWALHDYLWEDNLTFGEAVDWMKVAYLSNPIYYTENGWGPTRGYSTLRTSMVNQYNLIGDPTLQLQKPSGKLQVSLSDKTPSAGEQIQITITSPLNSAIGTVEISDENNFKYINESFTVSSGQVTIPFNVPDSIAGVFLKVKAYVTNGSSDASGYTTLIPEKSIITGIEFVPQVPQVNEPVSFALNVKSHFQVSEVRLQNFRLSSSTSTSSVVVNMNRVNDSLFTSVAAHPGFSLAGLYYFQAVIKDSQGNDSVYDLLELNVGDNRPDISVNYNSLTYTGNDQLQLKFEVVNSADQNVNNIQIACYDDQGILDSIPFFTDAVLLEAEETKTIFAPYVTSTYSDSRTFKVVIDPLNMFSESNESNNAIQKTLMTNHILIDRSLGSSNDGLQNDTLKIFNDWRFFVPQNGLTASSVFKFERENIFDLLKNSDQKNLQYISRKTQSDTSALNITINNSLTQFSNPASIIAEVDTSVYSHQILQDVSFFRFDTYLGLWVKIATDVSYEGIFEAKINNGGIYGIFHFVDKKNPFIEVTANGRPLINNMLLRANPSIAFLLQDENGIDLQNSFSVRINGTQIPDDELTLPDSLKSANTIAVLATPDLEKGTHTMDVQVSDINGNLSKESWVFSVSALNQLIVYGNYPNPFSETTIISYNVSFTYPLDELSVKIYTSSGHLIRKKPLSPPIGAPTDILSTDYHELEWDGTDDEGNQVANGVYFVVLNARFVDPIENKTYRFSKKLKVARLK